MTPRCRAGGSVGTFVGMLLHYPYINSETLGNAARTMPGCGLQLDSAKLALVSKIAQYVGILGNHLSHCFLMELAGC